MKCILVAWFCWKIGQIVAEAETRFYYENTSDFAEQIMAPSDWDLVDCDDPATCPGWPTDWEALSPYIHNITNTCFDCTERIRGECQYHRQSPIDLWRNITANKECKDRHRMYFQTGSCKFENMRFEILPHVLRARQPATPCPHQPNIDYSFGFPDPWMLVYTDVVVPSMHRQEGLQYDAEVVMSHVYSVDKSDKKIGNIAVFLQKGTEEDHYEFLEMYLQGWRKEHSRVLEQCNARRRMVAEVGDVHEPVLRKTEESFSGVFNPYEWYKDTKTHYYFRYEGSTPEPPCVEGVHWRVLKDPVTVAPSQITELNNLLANRVDPETCQPYTAAQVDMDGSVRASRPLQLRRPSHLLVFCECVDWEPNLSTDEEFCNLPPEERGVVLRTKEPTIAPDSSNSPPPTTNLDGDCDCRTEKSQYLCELYQLIHPDRSPVCT